LASAFAEIFLDFATLHTLPAPAEWAENSVQQTRRRRRKMREGGRERKENILPAFQQLARWVYHLQKHWARFLVLLIFEQGALSLEQSEPMPRHFASLVPAPMPHPPSPATTRDKEDATTTKRDKSFMRVELDGGEKFPKTNVGLTKTGRASIQPHGRVYGRH
jgi:hypothetical protein